jgi:hypothetical protein
MGHLRDSPVPTAPSARLWSRLGTIIPIWDNHSSHLDLKVINFARDNGIILLTFPTHSSHTHQPLDVSDYGQFKDALRKAFNDWQDLNPGGRLLSHQNAELSQ